MADAPQEIVAEVAREYETSLTIPPTKTKPQWILMPVGLIGAGKTTVVTPLAERFGLIRISTDEVRRRLKERGYSYAGARDVVQRLAKKYLEGGYSLALDANTGSKIALEYNQKTAEAFPHVRQIFIHINPPEAFIVEKLLRYRHTWLFRDAEHALDNFYRNKEDFNLPDLPFVYEFDTSRDDLTQQLAEASEAIETALRS